MTSTKKVGSDKAVTSRSIRTATNEKFSLGREERWPLIKLEHDYTIILDSFEGWVADINESMDLIRNGRDLWGLQAELESVVEDINDLVEQMDDSLRWCNLERQKEVETEAARETRIAYEKKNQLLK